MKQVLALFLTMSLCVGMAIPAFAAPMTANDKEAVILKDDSELLNFIKTSDFSTTADGSFVFQKTQVIGTDTARIYSLDPLNETKVTNYETEKITIIPVDEKSRTEVENMIANITSSSRASGNGSQELEDWDKTGAILAHVKVSYKISKVDGKDFVKLTKITGGNSGTSGGVSVKSQKVNYSCQGFYSGGYQTKSKTETVSGKSWSITPPSSWKAVDCSNSALVGANYTFVCRRGSSTWSKTISNLVYDN